MDFTSLLASLGPLALVAVAVIVFVENGLLFPFLPGDSLVFAAAILAVKLDVPWYLIVAIAAVAAIAGAETGFAIGRRFGRRLFRPDARLFKTRYLDEADNFFTKYGRASLIIARFIPIVRTYISPAVGASQVRHRVFRTWNAIGALLWAAILGVAGYFLGRIPVVANNIDLIAVGIVLISVLPVVITALVRRRSAQRVLAEHRADREGRGQSEHSADDHTDDRAGRPTSA